jgi:hypothetical protein
MATIGRANNGSSQNTSRRAYIATTTFHNDFFSYRTYLDADRVTQGELNLVTTDPAQAPKNRILRETGKKLFPNGVNPDVDTLMVGVYDTVTFLNGYIDPNSPIFAVYSTDFANFLDNGNDRGPQDLPDRGPPVLTNGLVEALSSITSTKGGVYAESTIQSYSGGVMALSSITTSRGGVIAPSTITTTGGNLTAPAGSVTVRDNVTGAHLYVTSAGNPAGSASPLAAGAASSGFVTLGTSGLATVNTSAVTTSSIILFTHRLLGGTGQGWLYTSSVSPGSFDVRSSDGNDRSVIQWFVVN